MKSLDFRVAVVLPSVIAALSALGACKRADRAQSGTEITAAPSDRAAETAGPVHWTDLAKGAPLADRVKAEAAKAVAQNLKPVVYVGAPWCEPCTKVHAALTDPRMAAALRGQAVIALDVDGWKPSEFRALGYKIDTIPVFIPISPDGQPLGRTIDGGAWGKDTPANISSALSQFFGTR